MQLPLDFRILERLTLRDWEFNCTSGDPSHAIDILLGCMNYRALIKLEAEVDTPCTRFLEALVAAISTDRMPKLRSVSGWVETCGCQKPGRIRCGRTGRDSSRRRPVLEASIFRSLPGRTECTTAISRGQRLSHQIWKGLLLGQHHNLPFVRYISLHMPLMKRVSAQLSETRSFHRLCISGLPGGTPPRPSRWRH